MLLNVTAVVLYAINLALRRPYMAQHGDTVLPVVLSAFGVILLSVSGYLGGVMVYDDGIAVGRHRRRGKTPVETLKLTGGPGEFVAVANQSELEDRQTLRVEINGTVVAVAKVNGEVFAFQEFCTHRFGPLSEGCFVGGNQIQCPWHKSCFDMRSGKVTNGPAKEDIRAFEIVVREGKVLVKAPNS
jgi:3-phenylpropionate/trans-cinnamate dioxygenase ferredoxin subunit/anthranilate 1,2-dioxygenase ferredoxin subunit